MPKKFNYILIQKFLLIFILYIEVNVRKSYYTVILITIMIHEITLMIFFIVIRFGLD